MSPSRKSAPSAVVGLDIGTDTIKVAEAKFAKDGIAITGLGVARTPQGVIENEVIVDPKTLGATIKALLAESGIKTKKCVSSVSGASQVVVRVISVPKMKQEELAETMKWEVERHVPFSPQEVVMDFQPLDNPSADPAAAEMDVLLAVAQQQLVESHVETLFAAGLQPMAIDIEPLASSRSLIDLSQNGAMSETVAVVNIGATRTDLGIYENGLLTFPSPPLGVAGVNFTREISEAMGQTLEQAEVTKREFAAVDLAAVAAAAAAAAVAAQPTPPPEPTTAFDTAISPEPGIASAFDLDDTPPVAEAAQPGDFTNTIDGPVFDIDDVGPSFDTPGASSGPSFDLGAPDRDAPVSAGPSFDLGGETSAFDLNEEPTAAAGPAFDLDDDEEPSAPAEEDAAPSFDLSDAGTELDHGAEAAPQEPSTPAAAPVPMDASSTEGQVFQAISGVLSDLANELRMSLDYYQNRYAKLPERMYLCGGTAKMPGLDQYLSQELGLPVIVADPVKNMRVNVPAASPQYLNEISPLLCVCMGLAIRDMIG